jgi:type VI secretion system protein VasD
MSRQTIPLDSSAATPLVQPALAWRRRSLLPPLAALALAGCGALGGGNDAPPQKEAARLSIAISADADLNVDLKGRGAPLLLRVYELKSEVAFQEAAFFALQDTDKAALGADLLAVDQFIIRPGETRQIMRKSHPEATAIAVFAGYRDLPNATWRLVHKMPAAAEVSWYRAVMPANKVRLKLVLHANALQITDEAAGQRPVQFANESEKSKDAAGLDSAKQGLEEATQKASELMKSLPKLPSPAAKP